MLKRVKDSVMIKRAVVAVGIIFGLSGCDLMNTQFEAVEDGINYQAKELKSATMPSELKVMSYNIKFGGGRIDMFFDCHGDRVIMTEDEVMSNMKALATFINKVDPDIIFLQEVDIDSKRSAYIDQLQYLLDNTALNYGVYASQWKADYVPSGGKKWIGKVNSGNAIVSKYPLKDAKRIALPLIGEQSALTQYFYLKRNVMITSLEADNKEVFLLNTHTSAYSHDGTKKKQLDIILSEAKKLSDAGHSILMGGDFNTLPPHTTHRGGFDDSACEGEFNGDIYEGEEEWMSGFFSAYQPAVDLQKYKADNTPYYSFTSLKTGSWNRKLDYLFTTELLSEGRVIQEETMRLSDHAPVVATFSFKNE
jgi:endonuclease/exonuclease/phosphatase family metal-dependent hydrolase